VLNSRYQIIGADWLQEEAAAFTDEIIHTLPSEFNERHRYMPDSVTNSPGPLSYRVTPYLREIIDCFDIRSDVREVNIMKGAQIGYTTLLESIALYYMFNIRTKNLIFFTAESDMAKTRIEANFIPMINQSGFADNIRSGDIGNARKTGKTATMMQFEGGGNFLWFGAKNPNKMKGWVAPVLLKDEIDSWALEVGPNGADGCPDAVTDKRAASFPKDRKIFRGSTPLVRDTSKIYKAYLQGDQRRYFVNCLDCGFAQYLGWRGNNAETGHDWGFAWETENGALVNESVRYRCRNCGHDHHEHDKEKLFSPDHGAEWVPTADAKKPNVRSYHIPAMYSGLGMFTWADCVQTFLDGFDTKTNKIINAGRYKSWKNNTCGKTHEERGSKIFFQQVSAHRRSSYRLGEIPNEYAEKYSDSKILMLTCQVDVHKSNLAVAVMGWCKGGRSYIIDYWRFEDDSEEGCGRIESPVWEKVRYLIEEKVYTASDGSKYHINITFVDAGYKGDVVCDFCSQWAGGGVYPIIGRSVAEKNAKIIEFQPWKTKIGTDGLKIIVDVYKERIAPVLRRDWHEEAGTQDRYHFNAPIDLSDGALKELTVETRVRKTDDKGYVSYYWKRPDEAKNELWDLLVYGHCAVDFFAYSIAQDELESDVVDMPGFWDWLDGNKMTLLPK
jgi:phage terminase large subunit GpA-like protein